MYEQNLAINNHQRLTCLKTNNPTSPIFLVVSLFNGISTLAGYLMPKPEEQWYYLTHSWEDKGVHTFPKDICPKVNVIARLEYELAYYDSAVHRFNHYTTRTPPRSFSYTYTHILSLSLPPSLSLSLSLSLSVHLVHSSTQYPTQLYISHHSSHAISGVVFEM